MKTGPRLAALFALLVSWLNSRLDSLVVAMKAVLNVETYLHCSQDLRGTQHGLWPGLSPNLHLHVVTEELEPLQSSFLSHSSELRCTHQIQSASQRRHCFWASMAQRLESLWTAWHDRASELQVARMNFSAGSNPVQQAAQLEHALASALAHAEPCGDRSATFRLPHGCLPRSRRWSQNP